MAVKELQSLAEFDEFIASDTITVVKISAQWCGSCQQAAPQFEALADDVDGKAMLGSVDVEANKETADDKERVGIVRMLPTFAIFQLGKRIRSIGYFGDMYPVQAAVEALTDGAPDSGPSPSHGRPHHPPFGFSRGGGGMGPPFGMPPGMMGAEGGGGLPPGMFGGMEGVPPGMGLPPHMAMPNFAHEPDTPPPVSPEAEAIVDAFADDIAALHDACDGKVAAVHALLNAIAQAIGSIFGLDPEQRRSAEEGGTRLTLEQLTDGLKKMVNDREPQDKFEQSVVVPMRAHTLRLARTRDIMAELTPRLTELHEQVEGRTEGLFAFVRELMPDDVREAFPKGAFCTELMHVAPNAATIPLPRFLAGMEDNLDEDDTVEGISTALDKVMS